MIIGCVFLLFKKWSAQLTRFTITLFIDLNFAFFSDVSN